MSVRHPQLHPPHPFALPAGQHFGHCPGIPVPAYFDLGACVGFLHSVMAVSVAVCHFPSDLPLVLGP